MNIDKHNHMLKVEKFESLTFALEYVRNLIVLTGEVNENDYVEILLRVYDEGFRNGQLDVLDRTTASLFLERDTIEEY